jgi:hypothetical protein
MQIIEAQDDAAAVLEADKILATSLPERGQKNSAA